MNEIDISIFFSKNKHERCKVRNSDQFVNFIQFSSSNQSKKFNLLKSELCLYLSSQIKRFVQSIQLIFDVSYELFHSNTLEFYNLVHRSQSIISSFSIENFTILFHILVKTAYKIKGMAYQTLQLFWIKTSQQLNNN